MYLRTILVIASLLIVYRYDTAQLAGQARPQPRPPAVQPPTGPLSVAEIIEALYSLGSVSRVEDLVERRGVKFQAVPQVVDILKEFGATDKLLKMIPLPPPPPEPKVAGPLTVVCEPADCSVVVGDRYHGSTEQGKAVITGLSPGVAAVQVISDGYQRQTQQVELQEARPLEARFMLETRSEVRQQVGKQSLIDALRALGGLEGMLLLGEFQGEGMLDWTPANGQVLHWPMTFTKRAGKDISIVFKPRDGQCASSILGETPKLECRGKLKNYGEDVADEATKVFLRFQIHDVLQQLLDRAPGITADEDGQRLESSTNNDSYVLILDKDRLPSELVYAVPDKPDLAVRVSYSKYVSLGKGRYPTQLAVGWVNKEPQWTFTLNNVRSRLVRNP